MMSPHYVAFAEYRGICHTASMDSIEKCRKLMKEAMLKAGLNPSQWARQAGVSESGVRGFLSGNSPNISLGYIDKLARAINLRASDFISVSVPIINYVGAGDEVFPIDDYAQGAGMDEIEAPAHCPLDAVAVVVRGDSMYPDYWPGDVLIYRRDVPFDRDACLYQDCVVRVLDGPTLIKRVKPGSRPDVITLESTNAPPRLDQVLEWGAPVLFHDKSRRQMLT